MSKIPSDMATATDVQYISHKGVSIRWDPAERLAIFRYEDDGKLTGEAADALIPSFKSWVGAAPAPYGILVDAAGTVVDGPEWRERWVAFHLAEGNRARIAIYRASILIQGFLLMYGHVARVPLKVVGTEREARAWLAAQGVPVRQY